MGLELNKSTPPADRARELMKRKADIEAELSAHISVLEANGVTMQTPLVDKEGFPRADVDIFAVRPARARIIELRNDLKGVMEEIAKVLEKVYEPSSSAPTQDEKVDAEVKPIPFAKVDAVAPGSPASESGLQRDDLVVKFGGLTKQSFSASSLQPLLLHVAANEGQPILMIIERSGATKVLRLTPRKGWGGRGLLGCHIIPYAPGP